MFVFADSAVFILFVSLSCLESWCFSATFREILQAWWWEKYLSKRRRKHYDSRHDKLRNSINVFAAHICFEKIIKQWMKICVYLAFLIGRLEISNLSKKLCRQCLVLTKSIKVDILYDCTLLFLSTFLVFCWFLSSFLWHRRCFKQVCECTHYTCYSFENKCRLITACY